MVKPLPAYKGGDPYVFVCYSHTDQDVDAEIRWIQDQGINVWYDEGISPGSEWSDALAQAIEGCTHFVYFLTPGSVASENCRRELIFAQEEHRQVLAVYLEETDVPSGLRLSLDNRQAILKYQLSDEAYQHALIEAVGAQVAVKSSPAKTKSKSRLRIIFAIAASTLLAIGLFLYSRFEVNESVENQPDTTSAVETVDASIEGFVSLPTKFSIAVLPFTSIGADAETTVFARGLTDTILSKFDLREYCDNLGLCGSLNVASSTVALQLAERGETLSVIADTLNVSYLLEGSVQRAAESLLVTARLIRAQDSFPGFWTKSYEVSLTDEIRMQTEIGQNIAYLARIELRHDLQKQHASLASPVYRVRPTRGTTVPSCALPVWLNPVRRRGRLEFGRKLLPTSD